MQEEYLLGGRRGRRVCLETAVYDWFLSQYGPRPCAEMYLAAFINAVQKYRHVRSAHSIIESVLAAPCSSLRKQSQQ